MMTAMNVLWSRSPPDDGQPYGWLVKASFAALLGLTMAAPAMTIGDNALSGGGTALRQLLYLSVAIVLLFAIRPFIRPSRLLVIPWPIVIAVAFCWLSLSWSIVPDIGARRLALTTIVIWSVFASVKQLDYATAVALLRLVLAAAVIGNVATALLLPQIGIHQAADALDKTLIGDWRGFMMQKNITAAATAFAIIGFAFAGSRVPVIIRGGVIALSMMLLYKTGSRTSLGMCLASVAIGATYLLYSARYRFALLGTAIIAYAVAAAAPNLFRFDMLPDIKDPRTLSGRLDIWDVVLRYSHDNQLLGAGYGSFWDVGPTSPVFHYTKGWVADLAQGHDGYLDLLATIGVPGLVIVVLAVIILPILRLFSSPRAEGLRGAMLLSMLLFCMGQNATESSLFDRDSISQVMLMMVIALLVKITPDADWRSIRRPATALLFGPEQFAPQRYFAMSDAGPATRDVSRGALKPRDERLSAVEVSQRSNVEVRPAARFS